MLENHVAPVILGRITLGVVSSAHKSEVSMGYIQVEATVHTCKVIVSGPEGGQINVWQPKRKEIFESETHFSQQARTVK